ncbi:Flp pilus assembly protein CpaB [Mesorhizobium sp. CAU 1741]|uniref:Flp pilus assembly protein CpaB n=1 Tax=Mesorhizobium sp. CAU 1741 TaxID=3140366 RepID=UPI00325BA0AA
MAPSRVIILGVAVVTAIGAGYVAKRMSTPPPPVVIDNRASEPAIRLEEVLVLDGDVPMGAVVGDQLAWQSWPSDNIADGFITRESDPTALDELQGAIARVPMYEGEPLRRFKLIGEGQSFMSSILPAGKRAVATRIAADTSAGGFILPNDFVDVIMTRRSTTDGGGGAADGFVTETILKNIRVLAIDQAIQEDEEGRRVRVGDTATLELTPQQAEIITVAQQMADRLTLALRAVVDTQEVVEDEGDYLVSGQGRRGTVRMIKSGEVSEVGAGK